MIALHWVVIALIALSLLSFGFATFKYAEAKVNLVALGLLLFVLAWALK